MSGRGYDPRASRSTRAGARRPGEPGNRRRHHPRRRERAPLERRGRYAHRPRARHVDRHAGRYRLAAGPGRSAAPRRQAHRLLAPDHSRAGPWAGRASDRSLAAARAAPPPHDRRALHRRHPRTRGRRQHAVSRPRHLRGGAPQPPPACGARRFLAPERWRGRRSAPKRRAGSSIRGGASDQTAYLLDGIPVFSPYHAAGTFSAWNPDALERLQVFSASPSLGSPGRACPARSPRRLAPPALRFGCKAPLSTTPWPGHHARAARRLRRGLPAECAVGISRTWWRRRMIRPISAGAPATCWPRSKLPRSAGGSGSWVRQRKRARRRGPRREPRLEFPPQPARNGFEWDSRSVRDSNGAARPGRGLAVRIQGWNASGEAEARWQPAEQPGLALEADREDQGSSRRWSGAGTGRFTGAGMRVQRSRTSYRVAAATGDGHRNVPGGRSCRWRRCSHSIGARWPQRSPPMSRSPATAAAGDVLPGAQAELRWRPLRIAALSASYARSHQFSQSLRKLGVGRGRDLPCRPVPRRGGAPGVPVGPQRPRGVGGGCCLPERASGWARRPISSDFDGLLLVAPRAGTPFATDGFVTGRRISRGLALDAAVSGARYGVTASYGWQRVRLTYGDRSYAPGYGTSHLIETGMIVFPDAHRFDPARTHRRVRPPGTGSSVRSSGSRATCSIRAANSAAPDSRHRRGRRHSAARLFPARPRPPKALAPRARRAGRRAGAVRYGHQPARAAQCAGRGDRPGDRTANGDRDAAAGAAGRRDWTGGSNTPSASQIVPLDLLLIRTIRSSSS